MSECQPQAPNLEDHVGEEFPDEIELDCVLEDLKTARDQLKIIHAPDRVFNHAAKDVYALLTNIKHWQDDGLVDEQNVKSLRAALIRLNEEVHRETDLETGRQWTPEQKGMHVLDTCNSKGRQYRLANAALPNRTAEGLLQLLANDKAIGWREDWEAALAKREEWENDYD